LLAPTFSDLPSFHTTAVIWLRYVPFWLSLLIWLFRSPKGSFHLAIFHFSNIIKFCCVFH